MVDSPLSNGCQMMGKVILAKCKANLIGCPV
jgi:hypothetical protein